MGLILHSEAFSPDGNLSAEGFENLLGTPSLELLAVLVREAVQNCCDATRPNPGEAQVRLRIGGLDHDQRRILATEVFGALPQEASASTLLRSVLVGAKPLEVLEIADYGTTGLAGPTRADIPPTSGERCDFVNFFRNVGASRDVEGGGGTYGYGKATLYRASRAHTILVDTATTDRGMPVRRFMAAQMGSAVPGELTGRHWWGVRSGDGRTVEPLTGDVAASLAQRLGMPARSSSESGLGTTIMILAPHLAGDPETMVSALTEYLLWNFWPRMMATTPKGKRLDVMVAGPRQDWKSVPPPEEFPPLSVLCTAMNGLRADSVMSGEAQVHNIEALRPRKHLGRLAIAQSTAEMRRWLLPPRQVTQEDESQTSIIPEKLHHVALMRPAQLVVRYEKGNPSPSPEEEWGGVFICSEEPEVEAAFAKSEPPAHDDWRPDSLPPRSIQRRFVNIALKRIRERLIEQFSLPSAGQAESSPLAKPSTMLGSFLSGGRAGGAGRSRGGSRGGGSNSRPFTQPHPHALTLDADGKRVAEFIFEVHADGRGRNLHGMAAVSIDGVMQVPDEATGFPEIIDWLGPNGEKVRGLVLTPMTPGTWKVRVIVPPSAAVGVRIREVGYGREQ